MSSDLLRQYRLGRLTETERHEIERRAFEDDAFEEKLLDAEADLLDDWARGSLSEEDTLAVQRAFTPDRLAVARSLNGLLTHTAADVPLPAKTSTAGWPRWAVAAALLIGLLPSLYLWQRGTSIAPITDTPAARDEIAKLTLHVPTTRGTAAPQLRVAASAKWVQATLDVAAGYDSYAVRVESARTGLLFEQTARTQPPLNFMLPANLLPPGEYDFVISGRKNGETALLATYTCRIERD